MTKRQPALRADQSVHYTNDSEATGLNPTLAARRLQPGTAVAAVDLARDAGAVHQGDDLIPGLRCIRFPHEQHVATLIERFHAVAADLDAADVCRQNIAQ